MHTAERTDAELVSESLAGNRDAFRQIVERYQTLICSLAYSALGSLSRSQDIAQETFLGAWKDLRTLRDPDKLRPWLCGIARHRIYKHRDRDGREPVHDAAPLDAIHDSPALEAEPSEQAISREEEAILWRSLERVPELYREPLVLYYREHQSIDHVAAELELSEDAVRQRLSRGRKLLQEEVQAFVEKTLLRTAPGRKFSNAVLSSLPIAVAPATAAVGAGAKGAAATKSGLLAVWLAPLAPFLGIAAGVAAQWLVIREAAPNPTARRKHLAGIILFWVLYLGSAVTGEIFVQILGRHFAWNDRQRFVSEIVFWFLFAFATIGLQVSVLRRQQARNWQFPGVDASFPADAPPVKAATLVAGVAGGYLAIFSWLISFAWRTGGHDVTGVVIITATMIMLTISSFYKLRGLPAATATARLGQHLVLACALVLLIMNLRTDVWVGNAYGVPASEAHNVLPTWIVPVFSFALVAWGALLWRITKFKLEPGQDRASK